MLVDLTTGLDHARPWSDRLTEPANRLHRALLAHRDGARIFAGCFFPLPSALAYGDTMIGLLRTAGLTPRDAAVDLPGNGDPAVAQLAEAVTTERYPNLAEAIDHIPAPHPPEHFAYGLRLLVNGLRAHSAGGASARS